MSTRFAIGSAVVLTADYLELFESAADLRNVVCEVTTARTLNGETDYTVSPVGNRGRVLTVYGDDIRAAVG